MRIKSLIVAGLAVASLAIAMPAQTILATGNFIEIPVSTVIRGDKGSMHELAEKDTPQEYIGMECEVSTKAKNQGSVHPGNDIVVSSGGDQVTLVDVERAGGVETTAEGVLVLGNSIKATLQLGQDKVFSAGMSVKFECEEPEPEPIKVCRDGEIIEIHPDERLETDTDTCPKVLQEVDPPAPELPNTGPVDTVLMTALAGIATFATVKRLAKEQ